MDIEYTWIVVKMEVAHNAK